MGNILIIKGADFSEVSVGTVDFGTPKITISSAGLVTIVCSSATSIYYTTDGTTPTISSTKYTSAFVISDKTTVKAIAEFSSGTTSSVVSNTFNCLSFTEGYGLAGDATIGTSFEEMSVVNNKRDYSNLIPASFTILKHSGVMKAWVFYFDSNKNYLGRHADEDGTWITSEYNITSGKYYTSKVAYWAFVTDNTVAQDSGYSVG